MCILVLKAWIYPQLRAAGMHKLCNPHDVVRLVDLQASLDSISRRPCHLMWSEFTHHDPLDTATEVAEARARPGVQLRWERVAAGHTTGLEKRGRLVQLFPGDAGSPVLESLLTAERERIELVLHATPGFDVIDVSQNPDSRARMIRHGQHVFMTVIAGSGYLVRMDTMRLNQHLTRLVTAADILAM